MSDTMPPGTRVQQHPPTHLLPEVLPTVPGYVVSREIARGGMGVVYVAQDPVFEREVAVKVMHPEQNAQRFIVESKVTAQLPHPGIPSVHAIGALSDGRPFLAMKLIHGRTFADELKAATRADLPRLLGAFERVCETVGFAHSRGIVHRDLKPSNVMVGAFGEVLVMDWGLARPVGSGQPASEGTPAYMAPEQARGEPVDARADVFALGGILAVILTGKPPFVGSTATGTALKAARADLNECFAELDESTADGELVGVAKRCLAAEPADRFADGKRVAEAMAAYRTGVEERLRRAERDRAVSAAEAREHHKRRKVQLALAAAVLVLVGGGGAAAWWQDRQATEQRTKAEHSREGVRTGLLLAGDLRAQYKFQAAGKALDQCAELARGGAPELLAPIEQARADLAFVVRLDDIRYRKWVWADGGTQDSNTRIASPEYREAFAANGLDLETLTPAEAAERIAASAVKADLVAAVDDWALYEPDDTLRDRLLEIARRADPGPWLDRLRDPAVRKDPAAVKKLEDDVELTATPSTALSVLTVLMRRTGLDPVPLLATARVKYPTDFELAFALGKALGANNSERAAEPYEAARALRPENLTVWNNLAVALMARGDVDAGIAALREVIRFDPKYAKAYYNLGFALKDRNAAGAMAAYREAIRLDPKYATAHNTLGLALAAQGDVAGAVAAFKAAVEYQPEFAAFHFNLGVALMSRKDAAGAAGAYQQAIRLEPKYAKAHYNLGIALAAQRDVAGAVAAFEAAIDSDPNDPKPYYNLGVIYHEQRKYAEALSYARAAINADRKYPNAHALLGLSLQQTGDLFGARAALTDAARLDKRWEKLLAGLPPVAIAPAPRAVKR